MNPQALSSSSSFLVHHQQYQHSNIQRTNLIQRSFASSKDPSQSTTTSATTASQQQASSSAAATEATAAAAASSNPTASASAATKGSANVYARTKDRGPVSWTSLFLVGVAAASAVTYYQIERERRLERAMGKVVSSESDGWTPRPDYLAKRKFVPTKYGWFPMADAFGAREFLSLTFCFGEKNYTLCARTTGSSCDALLIETSSTVKIYINYFESLHLDFICLIAKHR
jgi:hypothetical protein